jgi:hypothetical protein
LWILNNAEDIPEGINHGGKPDIAADVLNT